MYLLTSHIPIYLDGDRTCLDASWHRVVMLARDWFVGSLGPLTLLAPSLPRDHAPSGPDLVEVTSEDGIRVVPSFDRRNRARSFWLRDRRRWIADVRRLIRDADVVHTSSCDPYRPLAFMAHHAARRAGRPTVFGGPDMLPGARRGPGLDGLIRCLLLDRLILSAVRTADLTMLKEGLVYDHYAPAARNPKAFCHAMYREQDILSEEALQRRLATLSEDRPVRCVYAGRIIARKGLCAAVESVGKARELGANVTLDIIGDGDDMPNVRHAVQAWDLSDVVDFHGYMDYGPEFLRKLAGYDLLLFMPTEEDTPRMLYDSIACGLGVVGTQIPFLERQVQSTEMGALVPIGATDQAAQSLLELDRNRDRIRQYCERSLHAAPDYTVEKWFGRRARWIQEAVALHRERREDAADHAGSTT